MNARVEARLGLLLALGAAACGGVEDPTAAGRLKAPEPRQARVALTPALDLSGLTDTSLGDRIVIEQITVNLADARLLSADPRVPSGGIRLLEQERQLTTFGEAVAAAEFPFPESLLDDSLAIYVRLGATPALDNASVVVKARLYELPLASGMSRLAAAPEPDGDPANEDPDDKSAPEPDGDPAHCRGDKCSPEPDGDPAMRCSPEPDGDPAIHCTFRRANRFALTEAGRSLPFELRGDDEVDLVVGFGDRSRLDVLLGIPAARWFTADAVADLERALDASSSEPLDPKEVENDAERKTVLSSASEREMDRVTNGDEEDYRLLEEDQADPRNIRNR